MDFNSTDVYLIFIFFYCYYIYNLLIKINQKLETNNETRYERMNKLIEEVRYLKYRIDKLAEVKYQETDEDKKIRKIFKELEQDAMFYKSIDKE